MSLLSQSSVFRNTFYLTTSLYDSFRIRMIDYSKNEVVAEFGEHTRQVKCLEVISSRGRNREIVVAAFSCAKNMYFYNPLHPKICHKLDVCSGTSRPDILFLRNIANRFLIWGSGDRCLQIIRLDEQQSKPKRIFREAIIEVGNKITGVRAVKEFEGENVIHVALRGNQHVVMLKIGGIYLKKKFLDVQEKEDLMERTQFLSSNPHNCILNEKKRRMVLCHIKTFNTGGLYIFKSFLAL